MATHSSILAWRIPWTEEPGGLQSIGSQRVRHDWSDLAQHRTVGRKLWDITGTQRWKFFIISGGSTLYWHPLRAQTWYRQIILMTTHKKCIRYFSVCQHKITENMYMPQFAIVYEISITQCQSTCYGISDQFYK